MEWRPIAPQFNYKSAATTTKKSPARSRNTKSGKPAKKSPHRYHGASSSPLVGTAQSKSPARHRAHSKSPVHHRAHSKSPVRHRARSKSPVHHRAFGTHSFNTSGSVLGTHMTHSKSPGRHTAHNAFGKNLKSPRREMIKMYSNLTPAEKLALKKRVLELANKM